MDSAQEVEAVASHRKDTAPREEAGKRAFYTKEEIDQKDGQGEAEARF